MTLQTEPQQRPEDRLWSAQDCWKFLNVGQTTFYEICGQPEFPGPLKIGRRSVRWYASEVRAYVERQRVRRADAA